MQGFRNWAAPLYGSIRDNVVALRQFVIANCPAIVATGDIHNGCLGYTTAPVVDPTLYNSFEQTTAGYLQLNYALGDFVDGAIGFRAVNTRETGTSFGTANDFTDVLPNVNARFHLKRTVQGRLAFTQTRTLPDLSALNSSITYGAPPSTPDQKGTISNPQTGNAGNPALKPYQSDNYGREPGVVCHEYRLRFDRLFPPRHQRVHRERDPDHPQRSRSRLHRACAAVQHRSGADRRR